MPSNTAAWQTKPKSTPLEVKSAPYTSPQENEIVIKNVSNDSDFSTSPSVSRVCCVGHIECPDTFKDILKIKL